MTFAKNLLLGALLLLILSASHAQGASFQIVYNTPQGSDEKNARTFIEEEGITQTVIKLLNDEFDLHTDLTLFLGGNEGPSIDEASNEIYMPYSFVFDVADRFTRDSYSETNANIYDVTRDAYLHAFLHEVSHALFLIYDLRSSGNAEKAVDMLTILLLIRYYQNGADVVWNAAELFVDETGSSPRGRSGRNFWNEHALDRQSYNQAICLVYGSDPQRYSSLKDRSQFLQIRDRECVLEYRRQNKAWFRVLRSFLKRPPPG
ncbi:MAG: hypothetical protein MAG794_01043 [Gammaproteobacteria bacterium]|nr:hypothetical protein [Gammaproteobacteria bacterium]